MVEGMRARARQLPTYGKLSLGGSALFVLLCCGCLAVMAVWPAADAREAAGEPAVAEAPASVERGGGGPTGTVAVPTLAAAAGVPASATATLVPTNTPRATSSAQVDAAATFAGERATVTDVIDGDTIEIRLDPYVYRVRYIGLDAPGRGEPFYDEARAANAALVAGKRVILVRDVSQSDRYGRLLRYVYLPDGTFVNGELIRQGFAQVATLPPDVAHEQQYLALQQEARAAGRGLWAAVAAEPSPTPMPLPSATERPALATYTPAAGPPKPTLGTVVPP